MQFPKIQECDFINNYTKVNITFLFFTHAHVLINLPQILNDTTNCGDNSMLFILSHMIN